MPDPDHVGNAVIRERFCVSDDQIGQFCNKHHIRWLALFGSVLREDFGPDSDIDLIAEFESGQVPGLITLAGMEFELSDLLGGRVVDMNTPRSLSKYFREQVLNEAEVVHDQA